MVLFTSDEEKSMRK